MNSPHKLHPLRAGLIAIARWFDSDAGAEALAADTRTGVDWLRVLPFLALHLLCFAVIWVGWSVTAVTVAAGMYVVRMLAITGGYHRYFCHRAYRTSRAWQLVIAVLGNMAAQRGPLWWAAHHRHHHRHVEKPQDVHSPIQHGFWWSHIFWLTTRQAFATDYSYVQDWVKYPELRFLNRFSNLVPVLTVAALYALGAALAAWAPSLGTNGPQMVIWGFVISTVVLYHATFTINSLDHLVGRRRFDTPDNSRNNWALAVLTFGEGWHNNHHRFPGSARQGLAWYELDLTWWVLRGLAATGLIRDLKPLPAGARAHRPPAPGRQGRP